jgi:hypothetical protein
MGKGTYALQLKKSVMMALKILHSHPFTKNIKSQQLLILL